MPHRTCWKAGAWRIFGITLAAAFLLQSARSFWLYRSGDPCPLSPPLFVPFDRFMDFFNTVYWSSNPGRYTVWRSIYPPFAFLVARGFSSFTDYSAGPFAARDSLGGRLNLVAFNLPLLCAMGWTARRTVERLRASLGRPVGRLDRALIYAVFYLSVPLAFTIDRSNFVNVTVLFLLLFLSSKDLNGFWPSLWLACAISLKPFFALYGLLYLNRRDVKALGLMAVLVLGLNFLAMAILRDFTACTHLLPSLLRPTDNLSLTHRLYESISLKNLATFPALWLHFGHWGADLERLYFPVALVCAVVAMLVLNFSNQPRELKFFYATVLAICLPPYSFLYNLILLYPFIPWLFSRLETRLDALVLLLLAVALAPWNSLTLLPWKIQLADHLLLLRVTEQTIVTPLALLALIALGLYQTIRQLRGGGRVPGKLNLGAESGVRLHMNSIRRNPLRRAKSPGSLSDSAPLKSEGGWAVKILSLPGRWIYRDPYYLLTVVRVLGRFMENASPRKLGNLILAGVQFALKSERMHSWPAVLKIDISPLCNLKCTVCVHASPNGNEALEKQSFNSGQRMSLERFSRIIGEIKGKSSMVSLFYLGDPLMHPDLDAMCTVARKAGLNVHISSHFGFALSDERIKRMVKSGLTHLTVCIDGLSQEKYQLTRVGGKLDRVLSNVKRVCQYRKEFGQAYPKVEVQYLKFQHNLDELEAARRFAEELGVDQFTDYWGYLHNYTDLDPDTYTVHRPKQNRWLPQCTQPHFFMLIKYNGDVIPCCFHRLGKQYSGSEEARVVGNVFETSVWEVWNSPKYRALRRVVSNPQRVESEPGLKESFCDGCPHVYETNFQDNVRSGEKYTYEEIYTIGSKVGSA